MPRGPRLDVVGALHHVMVRGIERRRIFRSDTDRGDFLARLGRVATDGNAPVVAWSLLPNHVHLLLQSGPTSLSTLMRRLLTGYAVAFNRRHRRSGHLFQNRFKSILVEAEPYVLELVRYIHLNPLRAHLVTDLDELATYPWSGHAVLLGAACQPWQATGPVLERFGPSLPAARRRYREFVAEGAAQGRRPELQGGGLRRSCGGWAAVAVLGRGRERWAADERILGRRAFVQQIRLEIPAGRERDGHVREAALRAVIEQVGQGFGLSVAEVTSGARQAAVVAARTAITHRAVRQIGLSTTAVAKALGVSKQTAARALARHGD